MKFRATTLVMSWRLVGGLTERAVYTEDERRRTASIARRLVESSRGVGAGPADGIDAFMREYDLTTEEGVILLCLAEALLRIPDQATADAFLADKLAGGDWRSHLGRADSVFVNAINLGAVAVLACDETETACWRRPVGVYLAHGCAIR